MEIKITFTAWRETINRFQKRYHSAREILLLDHPLLHLYTACNNTEVQVDYSTVTSHVLNFLSFILPFHFRINQALMFDGVDDHVTLPSIHNLGLTDRYVNFIITYECDSHMSVLESSKTQMSYYVFFSFSFTISVWVLMAADYPMTVMPIVCSDEGTLCLYLNDRRVLRAIQSVYSLNMVKLRPNKSVTAKYLGHAITTVPNSFRTRSKTSTNLRQARENMYPVASAGNLQNRDWF